MVRAPFHSDRHWAGASATRAVVLGLVYASASLVVILVTSFGADAGSAFWPGAGVTVAVLLVRPRQEWPVLLAAVFVAEVAVDLITGFGGRQSVAFGLANCGESLLGAWLVRRNRESAPDLSVMPDLLRFVLGAVLAGPVLGAVVGTALPALLAGDAWLPRLPRWFVGDAVGVAVVAPFVLTRGGGGNRRPRRPGPAAVLVAVAAIGAGPWSTPAEYGLEYLLIPALVLVGLRLGTAGAATAVLAVGILIETVTAADLGPFAEAGPVAGGLLAAQLFLLMCTFTALTVAALTAGLVERERTAAVLWSQAFHDSLTGLANRRLLQERLEHALARLPRHPGLVCVICIDLDGFKAVNDRYGHATGDAVLVEVARRIERTVRAADTAARLGGDEFLVLVEDVAERREAEVLAARLTDELQRPIAYGGSTVTVGASVGLALADRVGTDPGRLIAQADRAMYRVKRANEVILPEASPGRRERS